MSDPHGGPKPPRYSVEGASLAGEITRHTIGGPELRFGVIDGRTNETANENAYGSVNGIDMPHLTGYAPQTGDRVAWLEQQEQRLILGEYGRVNPAFKVSLTNTVSIAGNTVGTIGDFPWDGNATTEWQQGITHSHVTFPGIASVPKSGRYWVFAGFCFSPSDGFLWLGLKFNGVLFSKATCYSPNLIFESNLRLELPIELNAGDYMSVGYVHNNSGGNINMVSGNANTYMGIERASALF